jgi:CheY-like chemotaxis protein
MSHDQDPPSERDHTLVKTILIVEDDADIGEFLERVISDETPYQALLVSNGFEALKITSDLKPDLLLLAHIPHPFFEEMSIFDCTY